MGSVRFFMQIVHVHMMRRKNAQKQMAEFVIIAKNMAKNIIFIAFTGTNGYNEHCEQDMSGL